MTLKQFFKTIMRPYKFWLFGLGCVGVYTALHKVIQPYVLKLVIDNLPNSTQDTIELSILPAMLLIVMSFIVTFIWRIFNFLMLKFMPLMKADIVNICTQHLRGHSYRFFQNQLSGAISQKISDLTGNVREIINTYFNVLRQGLTVLLSIVMAGTVHYYFALVYLTVALGFYFLAKYCANSIKPYASAYADSCSQHAGAVVDCFSNVLNMFLFAREKYESKYLEKVTKQVVTHDQAMQKKNMMNACWLSGLAWCLEGISVLLLLYLAKHGLVSAGDFAFIFILSLTVIEDVWVLTENLLNVGQKVGVCKAAVDLIFTPYEYHVHNSKLSDLNIQSGAIQFKCVSFGYQKDNKFFNHLNLAISGGQKVGLVGYSGAGKSTLVNLITKLYPLGEGEILIDDQNIEEVSSQSIREHIAFIPQSPELFHRSLYDNIAYGKINATEEDVIQAAKKANIHDYIQTLDNGYDTLVGERGVKLSGGQRQRIAIARAILKDAPILILDEATSSLDSVTEQQIQQALETAMLNKTVIVIAHRLSTILAMDIIHVLDNGRIIESGTHHELLSQDGFYKMLWDSQSGHSYI